MKPEIVFFQVGIVDPTRRALYRYERIVFSRLPLLGKIVHYITKKHHYRFTKIRNIHYQNLKNYSKNISKFVSEVAPKYFVPIAISQPGEYMVEKVYNIANDVDEYNSVLKSYEYYTNPYSPNSTKHLRDDGHHLNDYGHNMVYRKVNEEMEKFLV